MSNTQGVSGTEDYFERCIREKGELELTREYIRTNPAKLDEMDIEAH